VRYFISTEVRKLGLGDDPRVRAIHDTLALMFSPTTLPALVRNHPYEELIGMKATMPDYPGVRFHDHLEVYRYVTEQYVVKDYSRIDLLRLAEIVKFEIAVVKPIGDRCKSLKHFNIPYLAAAIQEQGMHILESLRREERMDTLVAQTQPLDLPAVRPHNIRERIAELDEDAQIDRFLRGR
jgi:hypothetical protein